MSELHKSQNNNPNAEPIEGQCGLLCKETLDALEELGDVLKCIHKRIVFEGYEIVNGVIRKKTARDVNVYEKV